MAKLYGPGDRQRVGPLSKPSRSDGYRSPWRRDYARIIHSPCFRRLQGKTQVFPGHESDFFRNRLTHSLEVAQVAKSIALFLNQKSSHFRAPDQKIEPDIVEIAGLAHDLGHPPFGHNGEEALDECMRDFGGFEGNAQSLRIVSRLEKKETVRLTNDLPVPHSEGDDLRCGLNLTYRVMASLLKYDKIIPLHDDDRDAPKEVCKGYYAQDADLVQEIKDSVLGGKEYDGSFKTIECSIMDIADDIAYSTYDLEDNFKAGFLTPIGLSALEDAIYESVIKTVNQRLLKYYGESIAKKKALSDKSDIIVVLFDVFYAMFEEYTQDAKTFSTREIPVEAKKLIVSTFINQYSKRLASDGYARTEFTSTLIQEFIEQIEILPHSKHPQLHRARLKVDAFVKVEILKNMTYEVIIRSPFMQVVQFRGKDIVKAIFKALIDDNSGSLLPDDFKALYACGNKEFRYRTVCDFIAGMTDRYAMEFFNRLYGTTQQTVYKPL